MLEEKNMKIEITSKFLGWLLAAFLPVVHITVLWYFWSRYRFPVNTATCTCECWDTIFKGPYENGLASYKHFYFNATKGTFKIWLLVTTGVILLYECVKHLIQLLLRGKVRFSMLILFLASIFPNYYSWWTYVNYINDRFYVQWYHQMFFTITEAVSTMVILHLANVHREMTQFKLLVITGISTIHLIAGGWDQFVTNILLMEGSPHQLVRDFGLVVPDILQIAISIIELSDLRYSDVYCESWYKDKWFMIDISLTTLFILCGSILASQL